MQIQFPLAAGQTVIREWTEADAETYFALRQDREIERYVGSRPAVLEQARQWLKADIQRTQDGTSCRLAIEIADRTVVGLVSLEPFHRPEERGFELVIGIARDHRQRHVAVDAAQALIDAAFSADPGIAAVYGRRAWGNSASRALIRHLGFRSAGLTPASDPDAVCPDRLYVLHRSSTVAPNERCS